MNAYAFSNILVVFLLLFINSLPCGIRRLFSMAKLMGLTVVPLYFILTLR